MHEQSETVERDGRYFNVYGKRTPKAGQTLPGEEDGHATLSEAVRAARKRSEESGRGTRAILRKKEAP